MFSAGGATNPLLFRRFTDSQLPVDRYGVRKSANRLPFRHVFVIVVAHDALLEHDGNSSRDAQVFRAVSNLNRLMRARRDSAMAMVEDALSKSTIREVTSEQGRPIPMVETPRRRK